MTYEGYLYKHNPQKVKEDRREWFYVILTVIGAIAIRIFIPAGIFATIGLFSIPVAMIQLKINDIKKKGPNRFGHLTEKFSLSPERFQITDTEILIADVQNFEINAYDYVGMPMEFFGISDGIDNYIQFKRNGVDYSFPFCVKQKSDLKILAEIEKEIQQKISV